MAFTLVLAVFDLVGLVVLAVPHFRRRVDPSVSLQTWADAMGVSS